MKNRKIENPDHPKPKRKKTGGRKAGSLNRKTVNLRAWATSFAQNNVQQVQRDFKKLKPAERVQFFEKILKFALPALQSITLKQQAQGKVENLSKEDLLELAKMLIDAKDGE